MIAVSRFEGHLWARFGWRCYFESQLDSREWHEVVIVEDEVDQVKHDEVLESRDIAVLRLLRSQVGPIFPCFHKHIQPRCAFLASSPVHAILDPLLLLEQVSNQDSL